MLARPLCWLRPAPSLTAAARPRRSADLGPTPTESVHSHVCRDVRRGTSQQRPSTATVDVNSGCRPSHGFASRHPKLDDVASVALPLWTFTRVAGPVPPPLPALAFVANPCPPLLVAQASSPFVISVPAPEVCATSVPAVLSKDLLADRANTWPGGWAAL